MWIDNEREQEEEFQHDNELFANDPELEEEMPVETQPESPEETPAEVQGEPSPAAEAPEPQPEPEATPPQEQPTEPQPQAPEPPLAAQPTAPAQAAPPAPAPDPAPQAAPPPPPAEPQLTEQEAQQQWADLRKQHETAMAESHYNLDSETVEKLQLEPEKVIPELMSRVFFDAVQAAVAQMVGNLPAMVTQIGQAQNTYDQHETTFFSHWDERGVDLRPYRNELIQFGQAYRAVTPNASVEDFTNAVGAQLIIAKGLNLPANGAQQTAEPAPNDPPAPFRSAASAPGVAQAKQEATGYDAIDAELFAEELEE